jgi:hypothetical protein
MLLMDTGTLLCTIFTTQFSKSNKIIYNLSVCKLLPLFPQGKFGVCLHNTATDFCHLQGLHGVSNMLTDFLAVLLRSVIDRFLYVITNHSTKLGGQYLTVLILP